MAALMLWMLVACTLGWCWAALRVSFAMARPAPSYRQKKLAAAVMGPFLILPFMLLSALLPSANARVTLNFTYCWVTPCKLLLLLSANFLLDCPSWSLSRFSHFLLAFLLPVRIKGIVKAGTSPSHASHHGLLFDLCSLCYFLSFYDSIAPPINHAAHCLLLYLVLDLPHRIASMVLLYLFGVETQPAFCKPWVSTSLTDFWGNRWDLTANALLRHTVYNPIVNILASAGSKSNADTELLHLSAAAATCGSREKMDLEHLFAAAATSSPCAKIDAQPSIWNLQAPSPLVSTPSVAPLPLSVRLIAVNSTFLVSGLIHELLYFSLTQAASPTWQVTAFFIVHGIATSTEITLRRAYPKHAIFKTPRPLKIMVTMCFIVVTSAWLFFPQLVRAGIFKRCTLEYRIIIKEILGMRSLRVTNKLLTL